MAEFDFFECNQDKLLSALCNYFCLDKVTAKNYFDSVNRERIDVEMVMEAFSINLNDYDSCNVNYLGRHMSTTNDEGINDFKSKGILDLKRLLNGNNRLTDIIHNHGMSIDFDGKSITVDDAIYTLNMGTGECTVCIKGKEKICGSSYFGCDLKKRLKILSSKLYYYNATTEFFISGEIDDMKHYSTISQVPEILYTLDEIASVLRKQYTPTYRMCYDWQKKYPLCIVIEFTTSLADMETFNPIDKDSWYRSYGDCLLKSGYDYKSFYEDSIPKQVFDNFYLIRDFTSFYFWGRNNDAYGSLMPNLYIKPEQIKKIEVV